MVLIGMSLRSCVHPVCHTGVLNAAGLLGKAALCNCAATLNEAGLSTEVGLLNNEGLLRVAGFLGKAVLDHKARSFDPRQEIPEVTRVVFCVGTGWRVGRNSARHLMGGHERSRRRKPTAILKRRRRSHRGHQHSNADAFRLSDRVRGPHLQVVDDIGAQTDNRDVRGRCAGSHKRRKQYQLLVALSALTTGVAMLHFEDSDDEVRG
mmetsp:Transcript_88603/g.249646  ORF Transcript_88603/g.249646 Transcript_88603/m.249646 type:complete len:207 (-) Transcript_88603:313-933(-)